MIHQTLQDVLQLIWVIITSLSWSRDSYYCNTRRNQGLFVPTVLYCPFFYSPCLISQSSYDSKPKHTAYTSEFTLVESENIKQYRTNKESKKLASAIVLHTKHDVTQKKQQLIMTFQSISTSENKNFMFKAQYIVASQWGKEKPWTKGAGPVRKVINHEYFHLLTHSCS